MFFDGNVLFDGVRSYFRGEEVIKDMCRGRQLGLRRCVPEFLEGK